MMKLIKHSICIILVVIALLMRCPFLCMQRFGSNTNFRSVDLILPRTHQATKPFLPTLKIKVVKPLFCVQIAHYLF